MSRVHHLRAYFYAAVAFALISLVAVTLAGRSFAQGEVMPEPAPAGAAASAATVGSGFAYQGRVADDTGNPIDGPCDLRFDLYDAASGGTKIGEVLSPNQPVADGLFALTLDFGAAAFRGDARWLEIAVRCPAGSGTYRTLDGRQSVSAVPYAMGLRPGAQIIGSLSGGVAGLGVINNSSGFSVGLFGQSTGTSGTGIGVAGRSASPDGFGVHGISEPTGTGVRGIAFAGTGVWGSSVDWVGTYGYSEKYQGVLGQSGTGAGVVGVSDAWIGTYGESDTYVGVWGQSVDSTGVRAFSQNGMGLHASSETGLAARFDGRASADILEITGGSDLAERFEVSGGAVVEPGTVMIIDADNPGHLTPSTVAYDRKVAGVVSGAGDVATGLVLHQAGVLEGDTVVAIAGRVYVRAEALSGPIAPGDLLTTSDRPGYAMAAIDHDRAQGAVIGKAMTGLESGTGLVLVLINLQ